MFKRLLLFLCCVAMLCGAAKADATAYWTLTFPASEQESVSNYSTTWTASQEAGGAWSIYAFNNNQKNWAFIRCGNKSVAYNEDNADAGAAYIATTTAAEEAISEVVVTVDKVTTSDLYKDPYLVVATDADFTDVVETVTLSTEDLAAGDWTFSISEATANAYYKLVFNMNATSSNGTLQISQVAYNYSSSDDEEDDDAEKGVIYLLGANGDWTMAATNINLTETKAGSKIYYNEAVTFAAGDYIAIYTQIDTSWGKTYRYAGYSGGEAISLNTVTSLYNNATLGWETSFYVSTAGTYAVTVDMSDSTNMTILLYDDSYTVQLPNNLYFFGNDGVWSTTAHGGALTETSEGIWKGEMTVTSGYFSLIDTISETSDDWTIINAHRYYPAGSSAITLGDSTSMGYGADGSWSIDNGTYDVVVNCNTLKLIVTEPGSEEEEEEATADTLTVAEALAIINDGTYTSDKVLVKGIISSGVSISTSYGNANYYISDDGGTDTQLYVYRGFGVDSVKFTSEDDLVVGDTVIIYGALTLYYSTPEIASYNYLVYQGKVDRTEEDEEETVVDTLTVAEALTSITEGTYTSDKVYVKGIVNYIKELSTSYGNATYSLVDNTGDADTLLVYRGYSLDGAKFTSEDELLAGDTVIIYGTLTLYGSTPEVTTGSSIVYLSRPTSTEEEEEEEEETVEVAGYYTLATSVDELADGDTITLANTSYGMAIGALAESGTYFTYAEVSISDDTLAATADVLEIILEAAGDYWKLRLTDGSYLYACSTSSNQMGATTEAQSDSSDIASIVIAQDTTTLSYDATIIFQRSDSERTLIQYNHGNYGRFSCYKSDGSSNQNPVQIYRKVVAEEEEEEEEEEEGITEGDYYFKVSGEYQYLQRAGNWGTELTLGSVGTLFTLVYNEDGTFYLESTDSKAAGCTYYYVTGPTSAYCDASSGAASWSLEDAADGTYYIVNSNGNYLTGAYYEDTSLGYGYYYIGETTSDAPAFELLSRAEYIESLSARLDDQAATAAEAAGLTATSVEELESAVAEYTATEVELSYDDFADIYTNANAHASAAISDPTIEVYNGTGGAEQTLSGLTAGLYKVEVNAMSRTFLQSAYTADATLADVSSDAAYIYANDAIDQTGFYGDYEGYLDINTISDFTTAAAEGGYAKVLYVYVADGDDLTIGFATPYRTNYHAPWTITANWAVTLLSADTDTETGIESLSTETSTQPQRIYTLAGVKLNSLTGAPAGIYIVDGQKVLVK